MNIVAISALPYGSVAGTMLRISQYAISKGHKYNTFSKPIEFYDKKIPNHEFIGTHKSIKWNNFLSVYSGYDGIFAKRATKKLIEKLKQLNPDVIHLHNLHGWFINLPLLFNYIKKNNIRVLWKFSDCWPFTAQCTGFASVNCRKWIDQCYDCPQFKCYPQTKFDNTHNMYKLKKKWFTGVAKMTIVTPSNWLGGLVKQSFLGGYNIVTIPNGIDLSIFKPTPSRFREKYNLQNKYIVLGVASDWSERKGIDVMVKLSESLDTNYQVVVVGLNKKNKWDNGRILFISNQDANSLAEIYTAADVFANPTREETFGLVNVESIACGTPVVMFNTDGAPECIDESCGIVVEKENVQAMIQSIRKVCEDKIFSDEACVNYAQKFEKNKIYEKYLDAYTELVKS